MKDELITQYSHTWRTLSAIINDFKDSEWLKRNAGFTCPAVIGLHILQGTKYYLQDSYTITFPSGSSFDINSKDVSPDQLPARGDILDCIHVFSGKTENWLSELDFDAVNSSFSWAGKTQFGVALFLLRHNQFHIGELNCLLELQREGKAADHYADTLD